MAVPGNTTPKVSIEKVVENRFAKDRAEWNALECDNKDQTGRSINDLDRWVRSIAECLAIKNGVTTIANSDQIGPDQYSHGIHTISRSFGILAGGQLMNALGNNNDCLIHSFLTCVSPTFRNVVEQSRIRIAGYLRRFVLPTIIESSYNQADANIIYLLHRLESYHFLTGGDIDFLSSHYQVPIINIQDGNGPLQRSMEIFPKINNTNFWNSKSGTYTGPFYVIHGDDTHFTPVIYGGAYEIKERRADLIKIASDITQAHAAVFEAASEESAKLETVKEDFRYRIQPIIVSIKKDMAASNNTNVESKSITSSSMLEVLTPITKQYVDDIIDQNLIDIKLKDQIYAAIYTVLLEELATNTKNNNKALTTSNVSTTTSNVSTNDIKKIEEYAGQYGLSDEDALLKAIKASLNESTGVGSARGSSSNQVTQVKPASPVSINQSMLRTMSMKARIGNGPETQYSATVYKPATAVVNGGKRNTKKAKRAKKQKTKKLKKRSV